MKRSEMLDLLAQVLDRPDIPVAGLEGIILQAIEKAGMKPPRLPEDHCQALMRIYYGGYTFNQWEEDFQKDQKAVESLDQFNKRFVK